MKDYSKHTAYAGRHMVEGWIEIDGRVSEAQGFYCTNGTQVPDRYNAYMPDGSVGPADTNDYPMYFSPQTGYSSSLKSFHAKREDAVKDAREYIAKQRQYLDELEAAL